MSESQPVSTPEKVVTEAKVEAAKSSGSSPLRIFSHSAIIYWWPLWVLGLLFYVLSVTGFGDNEAAQRIMGITYVFALLFVIFSTTVRLRGANSVIFGLTVLIGFILLATSGLTGALGTFIGSLDIRMSPTFYLVLGIGVLFEWTLSENGANAKCTYRSDDFLRHRILGLMMVGDLEITLGDGRVWSLHNVVGARRHARRINELIILRPID